MKSNDLKVLGLFLIGVALLLGLMYVNDSGRALPVFDGDTTQDFELSMVRYNKEVVAGSFLDARLEIHNLGETGSMFVECGVYDRNTDSGSWVPRSAQVTMLDEENNCQPGEVFVNTAQVYLKKGEKTSVDFKMKVPVSYGSDVALYCNAFERCWSESTPNTHQSSKLLYEISVLPASGNGASDDAVDDEVIIVDENNLSGTNTKLKLWMRENSILFIAVVLLLMIIGAAFVYATPKNKNVSMWD
jgi:hypothetical protein